MSGALTSWRYLALHLLGRGDEAVRVIEPVPGSYDHWTFTQTNDMANDAYREGRISVARAIMEQLHDLAFHHERPDCRNRFRAHGFG